MLALLVRPFDLLLASMTTVMSIQMIRGWLCVSRTLSFCLWMREEMMNQPQEEDEALLVYRWAF